MNKIQIISATQLKPKDYFTDLKNEVFRVKDITTTSTGVYITTVQGKVINLTKALANNELIYKVSKRAVGIYTQLYKSKLKIPPPYNTQRYNVNNE